MTQFECIKHHNYSVFCKTVPTCAGPTVEIRLIYRNSPRCGTFMDFHMGETCSANCKRGLLNSIDARHYHWSSHDKLCRPAISSNSLLSNFSIQVSQDNRRFMWGFILNGFLYVFIELASSVGAQAFTNVMLYCRFKS